MWQLKSKCQYQKVEQVCNSTSVGFLLTHSASCIIIIKCHLWRLDFKISAWDSPKRNVGGAGDDPS